MRFHLVFVIDLGLVVLALVALVGWLKDREDAVRRWLFVGASVLAGVGAALMLADLAGVIRLPRPHDAPPPLVLPATSEAPPSAPSEAPAIAPKVQQKNLKEAGAHHKQALEAFEQPTPPTEEPSR